MDRRAELLLAVAAVALRDPIADTLKSQFRDALTDDPIDSLLMTVIVGSHLFYRAERAHNPKVNSIADAMLFVSTSLSAGSSDIYPTTDSGKLIATALRSFGPAMSFRALDRSSAANNKHHDDSLDTQRQMLQKLDAILEELRARGA